MAEIIMAFAPLVFLIVYALKTRKMADAMILATLLAMCDRGVRRFGIGGRTAQAILDAAGGKVTADRADQR